MFRLKITLTHAVLICLLIAAAHFLLNSNVREEIDRNAELSLRRAAVIAEQTERVDHFALEEKGEMVAGDQDTYEYLALEREALLEKINNAGVDLLGKDVEKKLGADEAKEVKKADEDESAGESLATADLRHLAVHFRLLVAKNRFKALAKKLPSGVRNLDLGLVERQPVQPDMVMVLNQDGKAVAALGRDRYSWGSSSESPNIATEQPTVQRVLDNPDGGAKLDVWEWAWSSADDVGLYKVAVVPIQPRQGDKVGGVAVVGYQVHDGAAENIQNLVGGLTKRKRKEAQHITKEDLPDVAYYHGSSIRSSTFGSKRRGALETALFDEKKVLQQKDPEKIVELELDGESYVALVRNLAGQPESEAPLGVVVLANMTKARGPLNDVLEKFDIVAVGSILLGVVLMLFFYQRFIRPVGELEETIGEILSGNKDAEFVISRDDPIFSSLAQGLNLVSAYLQGKPMPDDEAELEGWGDLVGGSDEPEDGGGGGGAPDVQGVQMPGMGDDDGEDS